MTGTSKKKLGWKIFLYHLLSPLNQRLVKVDWLWYESGSIWMIRKIVTATALYLFSQTSHALMKSFQFPQSWWWLCTRIWSLLWLEWDKRR